MEIGLGFIVGVVGGAGVVVIAAAIVLASRKAAGGKVAGSNPKALPATPPPPPAREPAARSQTPDAAARRQTQGGGSGNTLIIENVESQSNQLSRNIQDVRDMLLRLADVISSTGAASGRAAKAFNSAKDVIDAIDLAKADDLAEAQRVLVHEIDRVLRSNAELHGELDKANEGIAEQRRQIEELRVQARIDGLTRIANRAAFDERLVEYLALLERNGLIFTLLMLDIDHFKKVNDDFGHVNGDRILRGVAAKVAESVRTNDFASRYGGEEFAVILPGTKLADAMLVAERVRQDIAKTNFRLDGEVIKMTISGGLAECTKGMSVNEIVARADRALYEAKAAGRNRMLGFDG